MAKPDPEQSLVLTLYRWATAILGLVVPALLRARARRGKEDPARLDERMGIASTPRPPGGLVWIHSVSVGESLSVLPLIERLARQRPDLTILSTSATVTAAALLARRLPPGVIHQYAPVDTPAISRRFLDHWRPDLMILVEGEIWPNLILGARARGARRVTGRRRMSPTRNRRPSRSASAVDATDSARRSAFSPSILASLIVNGSADAVSLRTRAPRIQ